MKLIKRLNMLVFLFISFILLNFIMTTNVYASVRAIVCFGGYKYELYGQYADKNNINFETLIKNIGTETTRLTNARNNGTSFGITVDSNYFTVSYAGGNENKDSNIRNRCYTVTSSSTTTTVTTDPNYYQTTSTTTTSRYHTKSCGSKYRNFNFNFSTSGGSTNSVDSTNGEITLTIPLTDAMVAVADRIKVTTVYNGNSKGSCTVSKTNKKITCSGILPYQEQKDTTNGKTLNSPTYTIYFSLSGISASDFDEEGDKSGYIASCGGSTGSIFLGSASTTIKNASDVYIKNPVLNSSECKELANIKAGNLKDYVYECSKTTLPYLEAKGKTAELKASIREKLKVLAPAYGKLKNTSSWLEKKEDLLCTDTKLGVPFLDKEGVIDAAGQRFASKVVYEETKEYWGMVCTEDYYVDGGDPSLVLPGTGVYYYNKVGIKKNCVIFNVKKVPNPVECKPTKGCTIMCDHGNDGVINSGDVAGGPTEAFDSCVNNCDGGKYTQKCINSCYMNNYSDERSNLISATSNENFDFSKKIEVEKVNYNASDGKLVTNGTTSSISIGGSSYTLSSTQGAYYKDYGNGQIFAGTNNDYHLVVYGDDKTKPLCETGKSNACDANCYVFDTSTDGDPGCVKDVNAAYNNSKQKSISELNYFNTLSKDFSQITNYTLNIKDSKTGYAYKVSGSTIKKANDEPELKFTNISPDNYQKVIEENIAYTVNNDFIKVPISVETTTIWKVELPTAYVKKVNANTILVSGNNTDYFKYSENTKEKIYKFTINKQPFDAPLFTTGQNVYYTKFDSPNHNIIKNSGKTAEQLLEKNIPFSVIEINNKKYVYELVDDDKNIKASFTVGGNKDNSFKAFNKSQLYCYYGVYYANEPGVPMSNGLRYYYREIKLEDVFPNNRNPRWNWTGTINTGTGEVTGAASTYNGYIVDPERLTEDIEKKGDSVYENQNEVDYEFKMTSSLISDIREYNNKKDNNNKRINTYVDFSLSGNSSNRKNFSEIISYWYSDTSLPSRALSITDCNNVKTGSTDCENYNVIGSGKR